MFENVLFKPKDKRSPLWHEGLEGSLMCQSMGKELDDPSVKRYSKCFHFFFLSKWSNQVTSLHMSWQINYRVSIFNHFVDMKTMLQNLKYLYRIIKMTNDRRKLWYFCNQYCYSNELA